jgi:hypothetical protein
MSQLVPIETNLFDKPLELTRDIGVKGELRWIGIEKLIDRANRQRRINGLPLFKQIEGEAA